MAQQDYSGTYSLLIEIKPQVKLYYTLTLSPPRRAGAIGGDAEMRIARSGTTAITGNMPNDFGSMLYVYLKDRERAYHIGDWTRSGNQVLVRLSDIEGRRDKAEFRGTIEGKFLLLTCSNPGMYGHKVEYRMKRDLPVADESSGREYRLVRAENVGGKDVRLEYTLFLRSNAEAEMLIACEQIPATDSKVAAVFGSLATVYLQEGRLRVYHRGTWKKTGGSITINLTEIIGRRDKADFTGSITPTRLELTCSNKGMYGVTTLQMKRDDINGIGSGSTLD